MKHDDLAAVLLEEWKTETGLPTWDCTSNVEREAFRRLARVAFEYVRDEAAEKARLEINAFRDLVGWQTGETRNELIVRIRDAVAAKLRAMELEP